MQLQAPFFRWLIHTMACVECNGESRYSCPQCRKGYCSVGCCKAHKLVCVKPAPPPTPAAAPTEDVDIERFLRGELRRRLATVWRIATDPSLSGEQTQEGRRIVALKKLRELRKGGREESREFEEFAQFVLMRAEPCTD